MARPLLYGKTARVRRARHVPHVSRVDNEQRFFKEPLMLSASKRCPTASVRRREKRKILPDFKFEAALAFDTFGATRVARAECRNALRESPRPGPTTEMNQHFPLPETPRKDRDGRDTSAKESARCGRPFGPGGGGSGTHLPLPPSRFRSNFLLPSNRSLTPELLSPFSAKILFGFSRIRHFLHREQQHQSD